MPAGSPVVCELDGPLGTVIPRGPFCFCGGTLKAEQVAVLMDRTMTDYDLRTHKGR